MLPRIRLGMLAVALGLGAASPAVAEEARPLRVVVGETAQVEVGFARMHVCDDASIVRAEMRDKTAETNVFVVTGLRAGTTLCRAGLEEDRPTILFEVTVVAKPARAPGPTPPAGPRTPAGPPAKRR